MIFNTEGLRKLLDESPELKNFYMNDATVHAWLKMFEQRRCTLVEALTGLSVHLAREKKAYSDKAIELAATSSRPLLLPHGATLLPQDESGGQTISMPKLEKGSRVSLNDFGVASGTYKVTKAKGDTISLEREE